MATLFGIVPAGQPLITSPSSTPSPTSLLYSIPPSSKPSSHITVFLLPNVILPENTAAAIYLSTNPPASPGLNLRFLGAIGPGKESAVFKIGAGSATGTDATLLLGISVEPADAVAQRLNELAASTPATSSHTSSQKPSTAVLAQRIIQNAFNFLASFSGTVGPGGVEVVPLRAFEDWWRRFESRVRSDPSFLEKQIE